jgi:hypothetical protein
MVTIYLTGDWKFFRTVSNTEELILGYSVSQEGSISIPKVTRLTFLSKTGLLC